MERILLGAPVRARCRPSCFAPSSWPAANPTLCATGTPSLHRKSGTRRSCRRQRSPATRPGASPKPRATSPQALSRKQKGLRVAWTCTIAQPSYSWQHLESLPASSADPRYQAAWQIYQQSLARLITTGCRYGRLDPRGHLIVADASGRHVVPIVYYGFPWKPNEFCQVLCAGDFRSRDIARHYRTSGLGISLVAIRQACGDDPFYPPRQHFPVTAVLRPARSAHGSVDGSIPSDSARFRRGAGVLQPVPFRLAARGSDGRRHGERPDSAVRVPASGYAPEIHGRLSRPRRCRRETKIVHDGAVPARQDSRGLHSWPVVGSGDLGRCRQRLASARRHLSAVPILVFPVSDGKGTAGVGRGVAREAALGEGVV